MAQIELVNEPLPQPGMPEVDLLVPETRSLMDVVARNGKAPDVVDLWRGEVDKFYALMRDFPDMEPDEIFEKLAGISARMSEIRSQLVRMDTRRNNHFRTQEVDMLLEECDRQFRLWSRVVAVRTLDQQLSGRTT